MAITLLPPKGVLGYCQFNTKTITIFRETSLRMSKSKLRRLTDLGECCIKIAQTLGDRRVREEMQELGLENIGDKEYPIYNTSAYWFFGVMGGLEVYGTQLCDGPRYAGVVYLGDEVFGYNCSEGKPAITTYIKASGKQRSLIGIGEQESY